MEWFILENWVITKDGLDFLYKDCSVQSCEYTDLLLIHLLHNQIVVVHCKFRLVSG